MKMVTLRDMLLVMYVKEEVIPAPTDRDTIKRNAGSIVAICDYGSLDDDSIDLVADAVAYRVLD